MNVILSYYKGCTVSQMKVLKGMDLLSIFVLVSETTGLSGM